MRTQIGLAKLLAVGALATAAGALYSPAANAQQTRSFYQNAGGNCHGIDNANDNKLTRTAQRLRNNTNSSVSVICNMMTDAYALQGNGTNDVVFYVAQWAFRYQNRPDNAEMSCTLVTSFATDTTTGNQGAKSESITRTIPLPSAGTDQGIFQWYHGQDPGDDPTARYRAPINLACSLPPKTELHDGMTIYFTP